VILRRRAGRDPDRLAEQPVINPITPILLRMATPVKSTQEV